MLRSFERKGFLACWLRNRGEPGTFRESGRILPLDLARLRECPRLPDRPYFFHSWAMTSALSDTAGESGRFLRCCSRYDATLRREPGIDQYTFSGSTTPALLLG